ncbi:hypothetical protein BJ322DRAFT_989606, partial [Thelephora terrestris]
WLKAYLNLDDRRPTWAFFADALICRDAAPSQKIDADPEARVMPIIQTWETRSRNSTLPEDLKMMLKTAKEFNVKLNAANPSKRVRETLPLWYHVKSDQSAKKLYKTRPAKCLRKKHHVKLVEDATNLLGSVSENHQPIAGCTCETCKKLRMGEKCPHPHECITTLASLIYKIEPKWNPNTETVTQPPNATGEDRRTEDEEERIFDKNNKTTELKDTIKIFGTNENKTNEPRTPPPQHTNAQETTTTVYTDGACNNNGEETTAAGSGMWYGHNDPRNHSVRLNHKNQSNQTGELTAILLAVKRQPRNQDLRIITD